MRITIRFGTGNELAREFPERATVGIVLADKDVKSTLGYGDIVAGFIGGIPQDDDTVLVDGAIISVHNAGCEKSGVIHYEQGYSFYVKSGEVTLGRLPEKPHVHVGPPFDNPAKFWLKPLACESRGSLSSGQIRLITKIARNNAAKMIEGWDAILSASGRTGGWG